MVNNLIVISRRWFSRAGKVGRREPADPCKQKIGYVVQIVKQNNEVLTDAREARQGGAR